MGKLQIAMEVEGLNKVLKDLEKFGDIAVKAVGAGMYAEAQSPIMEKSQRMVPIDTGWLKNSGYVTLPKFRGRSVSVELGYAASYATNVHEATHKSFRHSGTGAKFLSTPVNQHRRKLPRAVAERATKWLKQRKVPQGKSGVVPNIPRNRGAGP